MEENDSGEESEQKYITNNFISDTCCNYIIDGKWCGKPVISYIIIRGRKYCKDCLCRNIFSLECCEKLKFVPYIYDKNLFYDEVFGFVVEPTDIGRYRVIGRDINNKGYISDIRVFDRKKVSAIEKNIYHK